MKEKKVRKKIQDTNLKKNFMKLIFFSHVEKKFYCKKIKKYIYFQAKCFYTQICTCEKKSKQKQHI